MSADSATPSRETTTTDSGAAAATDTNLGFVALRDVAIVSTLLTLWGASDAWATSSGWGLATFVSVVNGVLVGAGITTLVHEWGHYLGARLSGGTAPLAPAKRIIPLFQLGFLYQFDFDKSETSHFQAMSLGGNVPTWALAIALAWTLPLATAGQVALVAGVVGFSTFASVIEFPVMSRVANGMDPLESLQKIDESTFQRAGLSGIAAALVLAAIL